MRLNPCELEIDLFCRGVRFDDDAPPGGREISRTRAGLGSGLELVIPTASRLKPDIWVNVPVVERFVRISPYVLTGNADALELYDERTRERYGVRLAPRPGWYDRETSSGVPMSSVGVLQGTYLGIYINATCAFWTATPRLNCRFCTTGQNVGGAKTVADVVETCRAAKAEGVTFVHLNGGFQGGHALEAVEPFVRAIKEDVGLLVGVQLAPERDFRRYDRLIEAGVDHFSFCLELLDADWFARICPGKARTLGQALFFEAMSYCAARLPRGAVSGEIIAGIEPYRNTIEAIDRIAAAGAFPTVCIFRPTTGSDMADWSPPTYSEMREVMAAMYDACRRHRIPIGVAPNIEVSLVVTPDDAAMLAPRTMGFYRYEIGRRALRVLARPLFGARMRAGRQRSAGSVFSPSGAKHSACSGSARGR